MDIKISSVQIQCRKKNIFVQLSNSVTFIYGNAGVGKTTLLNLINYGLGNNLVKTLAINREVLGVCLNILLNGELICLERKINSNTIKLVKNNETITLVAKYMNGNNEKSFSDFLYYLENIEPIEMLRKNSSKQIKVNFSNFMWYSYLRQEELDNTLFYLKDEKNNFKEMASNYVLKVLLGEKEVFNKALNKEINKLKEREKTIKLKKIIAYEFCSASKLLDLNISQEIIKKRKAIIRLVQEVSEQKRKILKSDDLLEESTFEKILSEQKLIGLYEAEIKYLGEFGKLNKLKNTYLYDLKQCERKMLYFENQKKYKDNNLFKVNLKKLEEIFLQCLLDVEFSYIESSDYVKIDKKNFFPSIYSKYGEFKFDYNNLSSGGKKTIYKICYALAIHIFVIENRIHSILPQFIIIDTPMKNISEREDSRLYENLYRFFWELFADGGKLADIQLIIVDKELPRILQGKNIMCKHMTNDKPLIPFSIEEEI